MTKQRVKTAAAANSLRQAIAAAAQEHLTNLKIAAYNERVRLTQVGKPLGYKSAAFTDMIKTANDLATQALSDG